MAKKIAVLGTGANGSSVAADLTRAGLDITLIDQWPAHVDKMKADGLTITMPDETLHVAVRAEHMCDVCSFNETFMLGAVSEVCDSAINTVVTDPNPKVIEHGIKLLLVTSYAIK